MAANSLTCWGNEHRHFPLSIWLYLSTIKFLLASHTHTHTLVETDEVVTCSANRVYIWVIKSVQPDCIVIGCSGVNCKRPEKVPIYGTTSKKITPLTWATCFINHGSPSINIITGKPACALY